MQHGKLMWSACLPAEFFGGARGHLQGEAVAPVDTVGLLALVAWRHVTRSPDRGRGAGGSCRKKGEKRSMEGERERETERNA